MDTGFWFSPAMGEYMREQNTVGKALLVVAMLRYAFQGKRYSRYGEFLDLMDAAQAEHDEIYRKRKSRKRCLSAGEYETILGYLNAVTGRAFRVTDAFRDRIDARIREGASAEDFFLVIDNQAAAWGADPAMRKYLRPETLFGTRFESYRNNTPSPAPAAFSPEKTGGASASGESSFDTEDFFALALHRAYTEE